MINQAGWICVTDPDIPIFPTLAVTRSESICKWRHMRQNISWQKNRKNGRVKCVKVMITENEPELYE